MRAVRADPQCRGLCLVQPVQDTFIVDDYCGQHVHMREDVHTQMQDGYMPEYDAYMPEYGYMQDDAYMQEGITVGVQGMDPNGFPIDEFHAEQMHTQAPTFFEYTEGDDDMVFNDSYPSDFHSVPDDDMVFNDSYPSDFYSVTDDESVQFILDNNMTEADMGLSPEPVNEALQAMVLQDYWTADIEAALKAEIDAVCESLRTEEENDTMDETDARETSFMGSQEAEEESQAEFPSEFYGGSSSMTQGPLPWKN